MRYLRPYSYRALKIVFDPTVEVAISTRTLGFFELVSNIGGLLGLFLGVSLLDIALRLEMSWECFQHLFNRKVLIGKKMHTPRQPKR